MKLPTPEHCYLWDVCNPQRINKDKAIIICEPTRVSCIMIGNWSDHVESLLVFLCDVIKIVKCDGNLYNIDLQTFLSNEVRVVKCQINL